MDETIRELVRKVAALEASVADLQRRPAIPAFATLADAGAAGKAGRIIYVVDTGTIQRDNGTAWKASSVA